MSSLNLRLVTKTNYVISGEKVIIFYDSDKKSVENRILKLFNVTLEKGDIDKTSEFSVKIDDAGNLLVSNPDIRSGEYLTLFTKYCSRNIIDIVKTEDSSKGNFTNKFCLAIAEDTYHSYEGNSYMVSKSMPDYNKAWDGWVRHSSLILNKKTKKLIPGHRYENEDGSIYYLGKMEIREDIYRPFVTCNIFTKSIPDGSKTITDIISDKATEIFCVKKNLPDMYQFNRLVFTQSTPCLVDSGEYFENNFTGNLLDIVPDIISKINIYNSPETGMYGCVDSGNLSVLFKNIIKSVDINNMIIINSKELKDSMENLLKNHIESMIINYMDKDLGYDSVIIKPGLDDSTLVDHTMRLIFTYLGSASDDEFDYIKEFIKKIGIDIDSLVINAKNKYLNLDFEDFDTFKDYIGKELIYNKYNNPLCPSCNYYNEAEGYDLSDTIKDNFTRETIIKMLNIAKDELNFSEDLFSSFSSYSYKKDEISISLMISINDLIKFTGGFTDEQKKNFMKNKIATFSVSCYNTTIFK